MTASTSAIDWTAAEQLDRDGYAVVECFDLDQVGRLRRAVRAVGPAPGDAFLATHHTTDCGDDGYCQAVDDAMRPLALDALRVHLGDRSIGPLQLAISWPGGLSGHGLVRVAAAADESTNRGWRAFAALDDDPCPTDRVDGGFWVVPGSHLWHADTGWSSAEDGSGLADVAEELVRHHAVQVVLGPGQGLLVDHSLLHFRRPNRYDRPVLMLLADARPGGSDRPPTRSGEHGGGPAAPAPIGRADLARLPLRRERPASDERLNARAAWCHRCGATDLPLPAPHPYIGRTVLVCDPCTAAIASQPKWQPRVDLPHGARPKLPVPPDLPENPAPVLRSPASDAHLRDHGWAKFDEPMLSPEAAEELRARFGELHSWTGKGFLNDFNHRNQGYRRTTRTIIDDAMGHLVRERFVDYEPFLHAFLCKWPGQESYFEPHRDWMFVDERTGGRAFVVFVALQDITPENGPLYMLPGSHRVDGMLRGTDMAAAWLDERDVIASRLEPLPLRIGESAVWNTAIVHSSDPNLTDVPRVGASIWMRPRSQPPVHFRRTGPDSADLHEVDDDFFVSYNPYSMMVAPPPYPVTDTVRIGERCIDASQLATQLDAAAPGRRRAPRWAWRRRD